METYTVNGMTKREVEKLGENRWVTSHQWGLIFQMLVPLITGLILAYVLPSGYKALSLIAIFAFAVVYWIWSRRMTRAGKELFNSIKEAK